MLPFFLFSRCLYLLVEVFITLSIQSVLVMNLNEDERFNMCLVALFVDSRINGGVKISIESSFIRTGDSLFSVHSEEVMCQAKILPLGVLLPTLACWCRAKERSKPLSFPSYRATSVPRSPVEA